MSLAITPSPIGLKYFHQIGITLNLFFSALEWNVNFEQSYKLILFLIFILFNYIECQSHGININLEKNILKKQGPNNYLLVPIHKFFAHTIVDPNLFSVLNNAN